MSDYFAFPSAYSRLSTLELDASDMTRYLFLDGAAKDVSTLRSRLYPTTICMHIRALWCVLYSMNLSYFDHESLMYMLGDAKRSVISLRDMSHTSIDSDWWEAVPMPSEVSSNDPLFALRYRHKDITRSQLDKAERIISLFNSLSPLESHYLAISHICTSDVSFYLFCCVVWLRYRIDRSILIRSF